jgi:hypothetical protein
MAKSIGISVSPAPRIWRAHGLRPHRVPLFKLANDPAFTTRRRDIVGLSVDSPAHAVVLSVDEKSQIQALDRTPPGLPIKNGRCQTMTHDDKRHGTTTLSLYSGMGRPSIAPEMLLRAMLLQAFYSVRSERQLMDWSRPGARKENGGSSRRSCATPTISTWLRRPTSLSTARVAANSPSALSPPQSGVNIECRLTP